MHVIPLHEHRVQTTPVWHRQPAILQSLRLTILPIIQTSTPRLKELCPQDTAEEASLCQMAAAMPKCLPPGFLGSPLE